MRYCRNYFSNPEIVWVYFPFYPSLLNKSNFFHAPMQQSPRGHTSAAVFSNIAKGDFEPKLTLKPNPPMHLPGNLKGLLFFCHEVNIF